MCVHMCVRVSVSVCMCMYAARMCEWERESGVCKCDV